jgi:hypothetical protein
VAPSPWLATLSALAHAVLSVFFRRLRERPLFATFLAVFSIVAFAGAYSSPSLPPLWWLPPALLFAVYLCSRLFKALEVNWLDIPVDPRILLAVLFGFLLCGLYLELSPIFFSLRRMLP